MSDKPLIIWALERAKEMYEDENCGPLWRLFEDGDLGCEDSDFSELLYSLEFTRDVLCFDGEPRAIADYRAIVDALSPDGGAARQAKHVAHYYMEADAAHCCLTCGKPGDNQDFVEMFEDLYTWEQIKGYGYDYGMSGGEA